MTLYTEPFLCLWCDRFESTVIDADPPKCVAFPDGIPEPILNSTADHRSPYPGDEGIRFSTSDELAELADDAMASIFAARIV